MDMTPKNAFDSARQTHELLSHLGANLLRSKGEALKLIELMEVELDSPATPDALLDLANGLETAATAFRELAREREGVR